MFSQLRAGLRFANVISLLALFVALGGTGYAAVQLQKNSVGAKQIKPRAVRASELARNAVRSPDVKNRSLRAADFALGQLPAGPRGLQGPQGPQGPPGQDATAESVVRSAFAEDGGLALVGVSGNALSTTIDAPTSGYLFMFGGSDVFNFTTQDFVTCRLRLNGAIVTGSPRQLQLDGNGVENQEEDCHTSGTSAVPAGTHTIDLEGAGLNANSVFDETTLQVLFVPLGANGSPPAL